MKKHQIIKEIKKFNSSYIYTFLLGLIVISILISLVVLNPFASISKTSLSTLPEQKSSNLNKINELETLKSLNAKSSEFNYKYKEFLDTSIDSALKAKENLIIDKTGKIVQVDTTYQGLSWNYTSINENNNQFYDLWKDNYLVNQYNQISSENTFSYVVSSSITQGKRCYFDTLISTKYCDDSPISEDTTYELRDAYTSYPESWTMSDIFNEEKVKLYLMNNSVHNKILENSTNDFPYVYYWGDDEIFTNSNSRIASGNHLTYYFGEKLTNITLSFKAKFYGHLLAKFSDNTPFEIIATSDGDLLDLNLNFDNLVALRIISSPDIDKRRALLFNKIIEQFKERKTINKLFRENDDFNKLYLYYLTLSKNNNVLIPKKVNSISIGVNRLLFDEKDIDFGLRSGIYSRLKDTYMNTLNEIGFIGYDINFTPNKKRIYEETWFQLFKNGQLNEANRYFIEFLPIGYQVTKKLVSYLSTSPTIPFNKPFGWKKNTKYFLVTSKITYDYKNNFLLKSHYTYGEKSYNFYKNPPMINYNVLLAAIEDFVVNRFYASSALQLKSHFVSLFLDFYQPFTTNEIKLKYVNLATLFANVFLKLLTYNRHSFSMATLEDSFYSSYYKNNIKVNIFDSYTNKNLASKIINSIKQNKVLEEEILKKDIFKLPDNSLLSIIKGWRAGNIKDIPLQSSDSFIQILFNLLDDFSINSLNNFFNKSITYEENGNLLFFLSILILLNEKQILYENIEYNSFLEKLQKVDDLIKNLSQPTSIIKLDNKYIKSPIADDRVENKWIIGRLFDLSKKDDNIKNLLTNYYNLNRQFSYTPTFLPTWSPSTLDINRFIPDQYKGSDSLSREVQKGYEFMENKLATSYVNFPLVLGENDIGLRFLKGIINKMKTRNFIGGQNTFTFYDNVPKYKFFAIDTIELITRCSVNDRSEILAPNEGEWCGVNEDSLDFSLDQFKQVNGLEYMSFIDTNSFMDGLVNAFSKKTTLDTRTPFQLILKTIITYFWYLSL